jgi:curved DNA-binding protein CbpA
MTKDLYGELGIDPSATAAEVKRAYRKKIAKAHPDREGGKNDTAVALNEAWRVLGDEAKRKAYDETGATDSADQREGKLRSELIGNFCELVQSHQDVDHTDIVKELRIAINKLIQQHRQEIPKVRQKIAKLEKVRRRITRKKGPNLLADSLASVVKEHERVIAKIEQAILDKELQHAMLDGYAYQVDLITPELTAFKINMTFTTGSSKR